MPYCPIPAPSTTGALPAPDIQSIDHVGIAARRLAATAARLEALGFMLTPFSAHIGTWQAGGKIVPLGTGNRCVMFRHSFLEILGSVDESDPAPRITRFLARHQGAHIICFLTDDIRAVDARLRGAGVAHSDILPLGRDIDTPQGMRTMRAERLQFAPADTPEGFIQVAQHYTPEYLHQPRYMQHPNGCTDLYEVILVTHDLAATARAYAAYLGMAAQEQADSVRFQFPHGVSLTIAAIGAAARLLPGTLLPPIPGIAAVGLRCSDVSFVRRSGVPYHEADGRLLVPAEEAAGVAIVFSQMS